MTDNACSRAEVLAMERKILSVLEFEINVPTPNYFVEIFSRVTNVADYHHARNAISFLVDLAILMHVELSFSPAIIALSAMRMTFMRMEGI